MERSAEQQVAPQLAGEMVVGPACCRQVARSRTRIELQAEMIHPLKEAAQLYTDPKASANAPIKLGHIYLVRLADTRNKSFEKIVKLMVIGYRPEEAVTLRWELLSN